MIYPDVTEVFSRYPDWDIVQRKRFLRFAAVLMKQNEKVYYKDILYHNIEDLEVDLNAELVEAAAHK